MKHLLTTLAIGNGNGLRETVKPAMKPRLALRIAVIAALVAASLAAIADQSDKFVGAQEIVGLHEIPSFIADRVELTPGLAVDRSAEGAGPSPGDRTTPANLPAGDSIRTRHPR
jgi:hypothetical protein